MVTISINYEKCQDAYACRKCVTACPLAVLGLTPLEDRLRMEKPQEPRLWKVVPVFTELCTGCSKCCVVCPQGAIGIK